jgi:hypothetical protein
MIYVLLCPELVRHTVCDRPHETLITLAFGSLIGNGMGTGLAKLTNGLPGLVS